MEVHPYGWLSLLPSLVAIVLAIISRRVVISMAIGIFVGALITSGGDLPQAIGDTLQIHLWESLIKEERLRVFTFTLLMGAMVGVVDRSGGMTGLVELVARWAHNRRRGQLATWFLGLLVFFDDYANTVLLGNTLQPLCERLRISKEKLAYLVDSTAAPVAGLAIISTWVAGEIEFLQSGLDSMAADAQSDQASAFALFIQSIPYRFYVIWSLVFVFLIGIMQRDFGPMLTAERRELNRRSGSDRATANPLRGASGWWNAVVPILATVAAVLYFLYRTGTRALPVGQTSSADLWQIFGGADSYSSLLWGSLVGLTLAIGMSLVQRLLTWSQIEEATAHGAKLMIPALAILWLASALSAMTGHDAVPQRASANPDSQFAASDHRLYTGEFLAGLIASDDPTSSGKLARWMPTLVFILSAGISFATGTSWGTMAIVMPVAIPLVYGSIQGAASEAGAGWQSHPVMLGAIGSVLAGSIFGDHCSPISDTTVLSSQSCGCEHSAHVWTQLPYALCVGTVSIAFGTIPVGFGAPVFLMIPLGVAGLFALLYVLGSVPTHDA